MSCHRYMDTAMVKLIFCPLSTSVRFSLIRRYKMGKNNNLQMFHPCIYDGESYAKYSEWAPLLSKMRHPFTFSPFLPINHVRMEKYRKISGIQKDKTMADKLMFIPNYKIIPSGDNNKWLKRLDSKLNEPTNQNSKMLSQRIRNRYYKTFGTSIINNPTQRRKL